MSEKLKEFRGMPQFDINLGIYWPEALDGSDIKNTNQNQGSEYVFRDEFSGPEITNEELWAQIREFIAKQEKERQQTRNLNAGVYGSAKPEKESGI